MSVDTHGLVAMYTTDAFAIGKALEDGLKDYGVRQVDWFIRPGMQYMVAQFTDPYQEDNPKWASSRQMFVNFYTVADSIDDIDEAIIWGLTLWGNAHDLIKAASKYMHQFGDVYFQEDDIDGNYKLLPPLIAEAE